MNPPSNYQETHYQSTPLPNRGGVGGRVSLFKTFFHIGLFTIGGGYAIAVNIAIFIGYKIRGTWGALMSTIGCILPSFLIILAIALFFRQFQDNPWVARAFRGIRPCVVALIAAPTFKMAKTAKIGWTNIWIPVLSAFLIWMFGVSPIWVIVAAGLGGYLYGLFVETPAQDSKPDSEL